MWKYGVTRIMIGTKIVGLNIIGMKMVVLNDFEFCDLYYLLEMNQFYNWDNLESLKTYYIISFFHKLLTNISMI